MREDFPQPETEAVPEGYMKIEFAANIADPTSVTTRAVDPDGLDVNNMTLFCFNEFGLFISTETATIKQHKNDGLSDSGTYTAQIPSHTRIIHFLGNHSEGLYDETNFPGQTESMVIANMEGGSGMLVYWSRFEMEDNGKSMHEQLSELQYTIAGEIYYGIKLIRNQAKISIENWNTSDFIVTGFRTVNIPAFGTVAPHHPQDHFHIVDNWESTEDFITLPNNQALMSDIVDINTKNEDYIFETENSGDRQVSVIIRGHFPGQNEKDDKYYRIVMQREDGSNFMIRRNHNYNIHITGGLTYASDTFEQALVAPATNNAWISIDEWVNELTDGVRTLWVEQTSYVLASDQYAGTDFVIPYKYTENGSGTSAPTVTWIDNNVAYDNITNNYNKNTGEGTLTLRLYPMYEGNEQQVGSFIIKHGKLQRKVTVYVIKTQHFTPSWISTQVYGVAKEHVTLMFTIPETCPEALFPMTVLVSVNHLDVRSESGQQLPVYVKGEDGYFGQDWDGINYKYALTVSEPGKHRLFMHTLLTHKDTDVEPVHLEAEFFETITKNVLFSAKEKDHYRVFVDDLHKYHASYAADEELYYLLVPQKKFSPLLFTVDLQQRQSNGKYEGFDHTKLPAAQYDEFLIYTKTLSFYEEFFNSDSEVYNQISNLAWEGEITLVNQDSWSTNGRVMAFRTLNSKATTNKYGLQTDGSYNLYMLTNSTNNKDVVRVASNNTHSQFVFDTGPDGKPYENDEYIGNEYRSVIFDVAHYRPFRFAAQVQVADENGNNPEITPEASALLSNEVHGDQEEKVDTVLLSYKPGQQVDILLDITSFRGSDNRSVHPFGELFGEEFEVYIDAPMLEIDQERLDDYNLTPAKLRQDPSKPGRFIYTVSKKRADERTFGFAEAHNKDQAEYLYDNYGGPVSAKKLLDTQNGGDMINNDGKVNQVGERKRLPFKKTSITSKGDISITSNKDKVVFWDKTFKVKTEHLKGILKYQYKDQDGQIKTDPVPDDAFVAFVRLKTNARIGVVTLNKAAGDAGWFDLNLRDEYRFDWKDDPIDFYYKEKVSGKVYNFNDTDADGKPISLEQLYTILTSKNPEIILTEKPEDQTEGNK